MAVLASASKALRTFGVYIPRTITNSAGTSVKVRDIMNVRDGVCTMARMSAERDLIQGMGGNWSGILNGIAVIKASGFRAATLLPEQCPLIDLATKEPIRLTGEKQLKPSCELPAHLATYEVRPDVKFVCHTHPTYATAFATLKLALEPLTPDFVAVLKTATAIPMFPYIGPASEDLAKAVSENLKQNNSVLMGNHGLFTVGGNALEAFDRTHLIEEVSKTVLAMRQLAVAAGIPMSKFPSFALPMAERLALLGSDFEKYRQQLAEQGANG